MNMVHVQSSNIESIGYQSGTLYVRFHSGGLYAYYNVPESVYQGLLNADSHGHYFAVHVKNTYQYSRLS